MISLVQCIIFDGSFVSELAEEDQSWNPWGEEFVNEQMGTLHHQVPNIVWNMESEPRDKNLSAPQDDTANKIFHVEVWGKAAIGKQQNKVFINMEIQCNYGVEHWSGN